MTDVFSKAKRSWVMSRIHGRNTQPEKLVRDLLRALGFRFRVHGRNLPGNPDIVLPNCKTAIQVFGCFWHGHSCQRGRRPLTHKTYWNAKLDRNKTRDRLNSRRIRRLGWRQIVVWECQVKKNPARVSERLAHALAGLR